MKGEFQFIINGELRTVKEFKHIPKQIDKIISFKPHVPPSPHTEEQHELIESFNQKFLELLDRQTDG